MGGAEIIMSNNKGLEEIMTILSKPNEVKNKAWILEKNMKKTTHTYL